MKNIHNMELLTREQHIEKHERINIKSPASDRIKAEVKYEKVSFWCWQVFVAVSLFAFVTCIFSIGGFLWEVVRLDLGL